MEWICKKCCTVTIAKEKQCCGEVVEFEAHEHGYLLISGANGWAKIKKEWSESWSKHEFIAKSSDELSNNQCHSLPSHIITAMEKLIEFYDSHKD